MKSNFCVKTTPRFEKEFAKLDYYIQKIIKKWIEKYLIDCENPREKGRSLTANYTGKWRYRIGDYRVICQIEDEELIILAMSVGHRKKSLQVKK